MTLFVFSLKFMFSYRRKYLLYNKELSNHIRVIGEEVPFVRSVSIGIYIKVGSVDETLINNGITHFIEHMFFKGTPNYTARQLADTMSRIGGRINAYTSKEYVCFYAHVLDEHLDEVIDILSDMIQHSNFYEEDIEKEKGIILEEYSMYEDSPEEIVLDEMHSTVWPDHAIGYNIIGTKDTIKSMNPTMLQDYIQSRYVGDNIVISIVGKIDFEQASQKIEKAFSDIVSGEPTHRVAPIVYVPGKKAFKKDIEQGHLAISYPSINYFHEDVYGMNILSAIVGGGLNSRLFQSIREEQGLAYSIYSYIESFYQTGLFTTYAATSASQIPRLYEAIRGETELLLAEGITAQELLETKEQLKSNTIIGMENMGARMSHYGKGSLLKKHIKSMDDLIEGINNVSLDDVNRLIHETFNLNKESITLATPNEIDIDKLG